MELGASVVVRVSVLMGVRLNAVGGGVAEKEGEVVALPVAVAEEERASVVVRVGVYSAVVVRASEKVRVEVRAAVAVRTEGEAEEERVPLADAALVKVRVAVLGGVPVRVGEADPLTVREGDVVAVRHRVVDTEALELTEPVTDGEEEALALYVPPQCSMYSLMA